MTKDEAIALAKSEWWTNATDRQIAEFQLSNPLQCMPFERFHKAVEKSLCRTVFTHEFAGQENWDLLLAEVIGKREPPTLQEIIDLIPAEKRIVVRIG
jgi:hypothetical protein